MRYPVRIGMVRTAARAAWRTACGASLVLLLAGAARAQEAVDAASAFLPSGHWATDAVRRLQGLGIAERGYDYELSTPTQLEAARLFLDAVLFAEAHSPELARLVRGYRARFREEFPSAAAAADGFTDGYGNLQVSGFAGYERREGVLRSGEGYLDSENWIEDADWTGPTPLPDVSISRLELAATKSVGRHVAFDARGGRWGNSWKLDQGHVVARWKAVGAWIGRRRLAYGVGVGGSLVLSGAERFDGVGIFLAEPARLPWWLKALGPIRFETFVSRREENTPYERPWFWGARASISPHPRFGLGVTRGAFFGGEGNAPMTPRNVAYVLIGKHAGEAGEFEMQIAAVDARFRPPLGPLPLSLYVEWGFADSAGAWRDAPATVAGVEIPAVPRVLWLSVGLERTEFRPSCCGNPIWYRNWAFWGGWTNDDGVPLGHPLAGHGREWLVHAAADLFDANLRVTGQAFLRDRGEENLYAPDRVGRSRGAAASLRWRMADLELVGEGEVDDGRSGWRSSRLLAGVRLLF